LRPTIVDRISKGRVGGCQRVARSATSNRERESTRSTPPQNIEPYRQAVERHVLQADIVFEPSVGEDVPLEKTEKIVAGGVATKKIAENDGQPSIRIAFRFWNGSKSWGLI
jgi:hypothetical protein